MYLGTAIPRHKKRFDTLICALHTLISYVIMSRPLPIEGMTRRSVYGPARLLSGDNFSERVVALLEKDYTGTVPIDPRLQTIQTKITNAVTEKPSLKQDWLRDDIRCEAFIRANFLLDEFDKAITSSEISAAMTNIIRGES